jgi:hypothetical protein
LAEDIARLRKNLAEKSVSLNEAERRQEMAQIKAGQAARKQDDSEHPTPTTYEITLKNASSPGLPPPTSPKQSEAKSVDATAPDALDKTAGKSPDSDILLHETLKILGDYTDLLGVEPKGAHASHPPTKTSSAQSPG